ncbi:MAG: NERD domain-containing protein [[Eubacterium] siraeum]
MYTRLKDLREDSDLTQVECAKIAFIGKNTYIRYENGERVPPLDVVIKYAQHYDVSIDYIAGLTNSKKRNGIKMGLFERLLGEEPSLFDQWGHDDPGEFGEYLITYALENNNIGGYIKVLKNLYIPIGYGKTTEIDVVMIHRKGIFVFESKNYSGWIFGSRNDRYWTQSLKGGQKNRFYNPILQNQTHINALSRILKINSDKFISMIIFSERCTLKKVPEDENNLMIMKRKDVVDNTNAKLMFSDRIFSEEEVDDLYEKLKMYSDVNEEIKQKHINDFKK